MPSPAPKMKWLWSALTLLTLLAGATAAQAQLDTRHWLPTVWAGSSSHAKNHYIVISTPEVNPVAFSVVTGGGAMVVEGTVSNAQPIIHTIGTNHSNGHNILVGAANLNQINDEGLIVTAAQPVYVTLRHKVGSAQGMVMTGKGRKALGQDFRVGVARGAKSNKGYRGSFISVMATQDDTTVTFDDFKPGIVLTGTAGAGNPATTQAFSVQLDANQTYIVGIKDTDYDGTADVNDINGTHVTSDQPVAVTSGVWLQGVTAGSGQDIGIDQLVPVQSAGTEYVLIQGNADRDKEMETPFVVAVHDNTNVFVNGGANPVNPAPLQAGDYLYLNNMFSQENDGNLLVQASHPALMFQTIGGSNRNATPGFIFLPPLGADATTSVDNIPEVDLIGRARIGVIARTGAAVRLNGVPIDVPPLPVPGTDDWVTYKTGELTGHVAVDSDAAVAVTLYNVNNDIGAAGYFSGFTGAGVDLDEDDVADGIDNCPDAANPDQADADGDGNGDACDECPNDPGKVVAGVCGCGVVDGDEDGDGVECVDNCPFTANADQLDSDGNGVGDACEVDFDDDGAPDPLDGCPEDPQKVEPGQCGCGLPETDADLDGVANCVDNCAAAPNADQADTDGDGQGDACDAEQGPPAEDADGDGVSDETDTCPYDARNDVDEDGICGDVDNCAGVSNADQTDDNGDGYGDACVSTDATIHPGAVISPYVIVGPTAIIETDVTIEDDSEVHGEVGLGATLGFGSYVGPGCVLGEQAIIETGAILQGPCSLGARASVGANAQTEPGLVMGSGARLGVGAVAGATLNLGAFSSVGDDAILGETVTLGIGAAVGASATLGDGAVVRANARVGDGLSMGAQAVVKSNARVGVGATLGVNALIGNYTVVGSGLDLGDGAELADGVELGDDVTVGAGGEVRGDMEDGASLGSGARLGNQSRLGAGASLGDNSVTGIFVDIGAGCDIGDDVAFYSRARVGLDCVIGPRNTVLYRTTLGDRAHLGADNLLDEDIIIGDDFTMGANSRLWRLVSIGHGITLGDEVLVRARSVLHDGVTLESSVILYPRTEIGEGARVQQGVGLGVADCWQDVCGNVTVGGCQDVNEDLPPLSALPDICP